ncbi:MAG: cyclic nucleotide-binding domain-containing protein [Ilumatobacteraceae bacterium]
MKRNDPTIERLGAVRPFARCSRRELAVLARTLTEQRIAAGEVVMHEGTVGRTFLVIADGTAVVQVGERVVARLGAGDVVGEIALLDHCPRTATVTAETDLVVHSCTRQEFAGLLVTVPSVTRHLLHTLADRLRTADCELAAVATAAAVAPASTGRR